jgi:hypothetical protein
MGDEFSMNFLSLVTCPLFFGLAALQSADEERRGNLEEL